MRPPRQPITRQTWLWQLSYAVLGLCFLLSPIAAAVTGNWIVPAIVAACAIALLFVLNFALNKRPRAD